MFEGPVAQRSLALFVAGWLLLSFPLLGLWDVDLTVFGLPLFPLALFAGWALLIGALAWLAERGDEAEPELARRHAADAARHPADAALSKPPEMTAPGPLRSLPPLAGRGALSRLGAARRSTEPPPTN